MYNYIYVSISEGKANLQYVPGASPSPTVKRQKDKETVALFSGLFRSVGFAHHR